MNSLFKYVLPLLFAISLAACDSSAPNFEGTYGRVIDGKMTPIVKVDKKDGGWLITEYLRDEQGVLDTKHARTFKLYSHNNPMPMTASDNIPEGQFVLTDMQANAFYSLPKGGSLQLGSRKIIVNSGYYYNNIGNTGFRAYGGYIGGEVTKLD